MVLGSRSLIFRIQKYEKKGGYSMEIGYASGFLLQPKRVRM